MKDDKSSLYRILSITDSVMVRLLPQILTIFQGKIRLTSLTSIGIRNEIGTLKVTLFTIPFSLHPPVYMYYTTLQ